MTTETITKPGAALRANQLGFRAQLPFHYSAYWGTWSRVLLLKFQGYRTVELDLTPINPSWGSRHWQESILAAKIRAHCTPLGQKDKELKELPAYVRELMISQIGEDVTAKLIDWDWVSLIDPTKLRRIDQLNPLGGGCPVNLLLRDGIRWAH